MFSGKNPNPCLPITHPSKILILSLIIEFLIIVFDPIEQLSPIITFYAVNYDQFNYTVDQHKTIQNYFKNKAMVERFVRDGNRSRTKLCPIDNPMNDEIDIEDDISDIAEPPADTNKGNENGDDSEVREVKVTQTKSKRGGGKKKKSVEINL